MDASLASLINLYVFPTGRRLFALAQVAQRAKKRGLTDLAKHCASAVAHDQHCLSLERKWAGTVAAARGKAPPPARPADAPPELTVIDPLMDRTLTAIRDHAESQRAGAPPADPIHETVTSFLKSAFPTGDVSDITSLPAVEQLAAVDVLLKLFEERPVAAQIKELGLGRLAQRVADLQVQYRAALSAPAPESLAFSTVRAARIDGQDLLLQTVAIVLGHFHGKTPEHAEARAELLGPILEQNDAIALAMRTRRAVVDVQPETGAPDPHAPSGDTAPPAPTT
jgi:hypothetical protein